MNIVRTVQDYIDKMVLKTDTGDLTGMKALLLDKETTGIVSLVHSQSNILSKEVYLVERYPHASRDSLAHAYGAFRNAFPVFGACPVTSQRVTSTTTGPSLYMPCTRLTSCSLKSMRSRSRACNLVDGMSARSCHCL